LREVRVANAIESPHVVRVLEASTPSDALPFLAMERLAGQTLGSLLRHGKALADTTVVNMVTQIGSVLELAREAGIVHRDIKPQNLFLTFDDTWKILDFGVALLADSSGTLTRGGAIGTPSYMAPEQAKGEQVDHRADIYALGAVVYRCVTGRSPFTARDTPATLYAVVHQMPLRPSALAQIPPELDRVLQIALAKSRDARFSSATELATAIAAAMRGSLSEDLAKRARSLDAWREPE
jgi:serine/threonine-protein kinase